MKKKSTLTILAMLTLYSTLHAQSYMLRDNPSITGVPTGTVASTLYQNGEKYAIGSNSPSSNFFIKTLTGVGLNATLEIENGDNKPLVNPFAPAPITAPVLAPATFLVKRVLPTAFNVYGPTAYGTFTDFIIKDNGFIGVNTPAPSYHLDINGNSRSNNLYVTNNIGIGTTTPSAKLHLVAGNFRLDNGSLNLSNGAITINNGPLSITTGTLSISNGDLTVLNGRLIIGNGSNQFSVASDGRIRAREIKVDLLAIPDYVFKPDYKLLSLSELREYVTTHHHLPNIKSEKEYDTAGSIDLGELNTQLLEKVEELTLYILQIEDRLKKLENE